MRDDRSSLFILSVELVSRGLEHNDEPNSYSLEIEEIIDVFLGRDKWKN